MVALEPKSRFQLHFRAVCLGNIVEFYEWSTFSAFSDTIGSVFFGGKEGHLLKGLAVFGAGFLMRPLGGILFGYIGDKYTRERFVRAQFIPCII
jgi:MHS family proline/betaine transporter-like MFS transporter